MQFIDYSIILLPPEKLVAYFKNNNLDFRKPINIILGGKDYGDISFCILNAINYYSNLYDYYKAFIEAGADINVTGKDKSENLFIDIVDSSNEKLLELCIPHFKLRSNEYIMSRVCYILYRKERYPERFIELINVLVTKFNRRKWKRAQYLFQEDLDDPLRF